MVLKKINSRNSGNTVTGVVITLLIVMALFFGTFKFISWNIRQAGDTIPQRYQSSYSNLEESETSLDNNIDSIKNNFNNIKEAESNYEVAVNGFKGLGNTLKLPISLLSTTLSMWSSFHSYASEFVPAWAIILIDIGITAFIVLLILKVLKGEPNL